MGAVGSLTGMIRPAVAADAEQVIALERALVLDGAGMVLSPEQVPTAQAWIERLSNRAGASLSIVAEADGRVVGSADLRQLAPMRCAHVALLSVGVHPSRHRRGIGRALMEHLIEHAKRSGLARLELYVRSDNAPAQALYRGLGFDHEATRARFIRLDDRSLIDDYIFVRFLR